MAHTATAATTAKMTRYLVFMTFTKLGRIKGQHLPVLTVLHFLIAKSIPYSAVL